MIFAPASTKDLKKANRNRIYRVIHQRGAISRPELAGTLKMSLPTVIQNVKSLLVDGLVCETGNLESTGGRKAATLAVVKDARLSIGIDITKNHIVVAVVDLAGNVLRQERTRVPFSDSGLYVDKMGKIVDALLKKTRIDRRSIMGAGISFPGIISENEKTASSHILAANNYPLQPIHARLGMPCVYVNDANAAGIAETWASPGEREFVYLSLSDSVGGAVILGGKPLTGKHRRCGEFGHMTVERGGIRCYCGKKGCLDAYCAAVTLSEKTGGDLKLFFERLKENDKKLEVVWNDYLDYLACAVNTLHMAFDFDIVIGGYVGAYMERSIDELRERVAALNTFGEFGDYVRVCRHKTQSPAAGAALMQVEKFIANV